jgi:hypothetical protein
MIIFKSSSWILETLLRHWSYQELVKMILSKEHYYNEIVFTNSLRRFRDCSQLHLRSIHNVVDNNQPNGKMMMNVNTQKF